MIALTDLLKARALNLDAEQRRERCWARTSRCRSGRGLLHNHIRARQGLWVCLRHA